MKKLMFFISLDCMELSISLLSILLPSMVLRSSPKKLGDI